MQLRILLFKVQVWHSHFSSDEQPSSRGQRESTAPQWSLSLSRAWGAARWTAFLILCFKSRSLVYTSLPSPSLFVSLSALPMISRWRLMMTPPWMSPWGFALCPHTLQPEVWLFGKPLFCLSPPHMHTHTHTKPPHGWVILRIEQILCFH